MAKKEEFDFKKAIKAIDLTDAVSWMKSLSIGVRLSIIAGLIALAVYGVGYYKGKRNLPVRVDLSNSTIILEDKNGVRHELIVNDNRLTFDGKLVKVKDVQELKAYGISFTPKPMIGITSSGSPAAGIAWELAHFYKLNLDAITSVPFLGIGVSYDIRIDRPIKISNSAIGVAIGKNLRDTSTEALIYYTWRF